MFSEMVQILRRVPDNVMNRTGKMGYLDQPLPMPVAPSKPPKLRVPIPRWDGDSAFVLAVMMRKRCCSQR